MKAIVLTRGRIATVDDADFDYLKQFKWTALKGYRTYYAHRTARLPNGKRKSVKMHRLILGLNDPKIEADHQNLDGTDNRRCNLRKATPAENRRNRAKCRMSPSRFKGVRWHLQRRKWEARICHNKVLIYLGLVASDIEAAKAYNAAAINRFGAFAHLNSIPS